jgi:hypothetical protein
MKSLHFNTSARSSSLSLATTHYGVSNASRNHHLLNAYAEEEKYSPMIPFRSLAFETLPERWQVEMV